MQSLRTLCAIGAIVFSLPVLGEVQKFGKPLGMKEEVKISELLANPGKFNGQKVRVRGLVTWVCAHKGGTIKLAGNKKELAFKVPHGVIVFPVSIKGGKAVAEGVWTVKHLSVEEQLADAKEHDHPVDSATLKPKTVMYLDGKDGGVEVDR
jgi:hypothetical protein